MGGGGGWCDLVEGEDFEVGGGGEGPMEGRGERVRAGGGGGGFLILDSGDEADRSEHFSWLHFTGRAAAEEHSLEDLWSVFLGIQFCRPSSVLIRALEQVGASPLK